MAQAKFRNEGELIKRCSEYFEQTIKKNEIPSKAGLRVKLDISRETYSQYKKKYTDTIKKAENLIEKAWVQRLSGSAATGAIFYLKNAFHDDYKDRTSTDITSGGEKVGIIFLPQRKQTDELEAPAKTISRASKK